MVRTDVNGNYMNSAPCKNCFNVIDKIGIKKIIFSSQENTFEIHNTNNYSTNHVSNGIKFLNMPEEKKKKRLKKSKHIYKESEVK